MKKTAVLFLSLLLIFSLFAYFSRKQTKEETPKASVSEDGKQETLKGSEHVNTDAVNENTENKIKLKFQGKEIVVAMEDNNAARSLLEMLPLVLNLKITRVPKR